MYTMNDMLLVKSVWLRNTLCSLLSLLGTNYIGIEWELEMPFKLLKLDVNIKVCIPYNDG